MRNMCFETSVSSGSLHKLQIDVNEHFTTIINRGKCARTSTLKAWELFVQKILSQWKRSKRIFTVVETPSYHITKLEMVSNASRHIAMKDVSVCDQSYSADISWWVIEPIKTGEFVQAFSHIPFSTCRLLCSVSSFCFVLANLLLTLKNRWETKRK